MKRFLIVFCFAFHAGAVQANEGIGKEALSLSRQFEAASLKERSFRGIILEPVRLAVEIVKSENPIHKECPHPGCGLFRMNAFAEWNIKKPGPIQGRYYFTYMLTKFLPSKKDKGIHMPKHYFNASQLPNVSSFSGSEFPCNIFAGGLDRQLKAKVGFGMDFGSGIYKKLYLGTVRLVLRRI